MLQGLWPCTSNVGAQVQFLVGKLRSHILHGQKIKQLYFLKLIGVAWKSFWFSETSLRCTALVTSKSFNNITLDKKKGLPLWLRW